MRCDLSPLSHSTDKATIKFWTFADNYRASNDRGASKGLDLADRVGSSEVTRHCLLTCKNRILP